MTNRLLLNHVVQSLLFWRSLGLVPLLTSRLHDLRVLIHCLLT